VSAAPHERDDRARRFFDPLRLALAFLTVLPIGPRREVAPEAVAQSFAWFPIAGFMIGALLALEDSLLGLAFGRPLGSILIVLSLAMLTGAVHLDGLADTADALGAGRDRARALEIMRDSAIGSFGAIALFFVLALKTAALAVAHRRGAALYLAPGLARWAMVAVSRGMVYLRAEGAGSSLLEAGGERSFGFASITAAAAVMLAPSLGTLEACPAAAIAALAIRAFYRRWLGGVTGDLLGAASEIVETLVLVVMCI